jgi:hypothetical protein
MIHVLNECGTHCAVFGNHDFGKNVTRSFASLFLLYCILCSCTCTVFLLDHLVSVNPLEYNPEYSITYYSILGM